MRQPFPPLELPPLHAQPARRVERALLKRCRELGRLLTLEEHTDIVLRAAVVGGRSVIDGLTDRQRAAIIDRVEIQGDRGAVIELRRSDETDDEWIPELRFVPLRRLRRLATMGAAFQAPRVGRATPRRLPARAPRSRRSRSITATCAQAGAAGPPSGPCSDPPRLTAASVVTVDGRLVSLADLALALGPFLAAALPRAAPPAIPSRVLRWKEVYAEVGSLAGKDSVDALRREVGRCGPENPLHVLRVRGRLASVVAVVKTALRRDADALSDFKAVARICPVLPIQGGTSPGVRSPS